MIEDPPLLRINTARNRPSADQIAAFQGVPTGFVVDAMFGRGALDRRIQPLEGNAMTGQVAGPALTAGCVAGDILGTLAALNFLQAGDVLVAAFDGFDGCAAAGDRVLGMAKNAGAVGFVSDGPVRDYAGIAALDFPAWCAGLTPNSPVSNGPGTVGHAISLGGKQVSSGDMIVADRDGVVVVPFAQIDAVLAQLETVKELEVALDADVAAGLTVPPAIQALLNSDKTRYEP